MKKSKKISRNKLRKIETNWHWERDNSKPMGCSKSSSKREVYSNTILHQETRKHQINNLTLHLKQLEKGEQKNPPKLVEGDKS